MLLLAILGGIAAAWTIVAAHLAVLVGRVARARDAHS
ncbi:hypothetical protein SAMN06295924_102183 [Rathayibacter rathayi NCPPB 2980 = VKM Ac-1601]|nr:hypothetical protein FB469_1809 [Rathayibacter rathayi]SOE03280.1 hypothetical protein SAMN06295924_102183 [Rathayibacter rathayi NCPPB 2980 = VKM Ac-1601]